MNLSREQLAGPALEARVVLPPAFLRDRRPPVPPLLADPLLLGGAAIAFVLGGLVKGTVSLLPAAS